MRIFAIIIFLVAFMTLKAQNNQSPCSSPESSQFDFWLGDWDLTYSDTIHATNHIEKIMGGCTVQENFNDPHGNYIGKSWSVYNKNYKIWEQTWVDNKGGYTSVSGGMQGDSMVLKTEEKTVPLNISPTGKIINRMVYHNITKNAFDWDWESSTDNSKTWKINWHIHYARKNA